MAIRKIPKLWDHQKETIKFSNRRKVVFDTVDGRRSARWAMFLTLKVDRLFQLA